MASFGGGGGGGGGHQEDSRDIKQLEDAVERARREESKASDVNAQYYAAMLEMKAKHDALELQLTSIVTEGRANDDRRQESEQKYGEQKESKTLWEIQNNKLRVAYKKIEWQMSDIRDAVGENRRQQKLGSEMVVRAMDVTNAATDALRNRLARNTLPR